MATIVHVHEMRPESDTAFSCKQASERSERVNVGLLDVMTGIRSFLRNPERREAELVVLSRFVGTTDRAA